MNKTVVFFESKCKRIKQIAVAKREGGPLLDFVQLKVLYWNLYGLGMAEIEMSDPGIPSLSKSVQRAYVSENVPCTTLVVTPNFKLK